MASVGFKLIDERVEFTSPRSVGTANSVLMSLQIPVTKAILFTLTSGNVTVLNAGQPGSVTVDIWQRPATGPQPKAPLWSHVFPVSAGLQEPVLTRAGVLKPVAGAGDTLSIEWSATNSDIAVMPETISFNGVALDDYSSTSQVVGQYATWPTRPNYTSFTKMFTSIGYLPLAATTDGGDVLVVVDLGTPTPPHPADGTYQVQVREVLPAGETPVRYYGNWQDGVIARQTMSYPFNRAVVLGAYSRPQVSAGTQLWIEIRSDDTPAPEIPGANYVTFYVLQQLHVSPATGPLLGYSRWVNPSHTDITSLTDRDPFAPPHLSSMEVGRASLPGGGTMHSIASLGALTFDRPITDIQIAFADISGANQTMASTNFRHGFGPAMLCASDRSFKPTSPDTRANLFARSVDSQGKQHWDFWGKIPADSSAFLAYIYEPR